MSRRCAPGHVVNRCACFQCRLHRAERSLRQRRGQADSRVPYAAVERHLRYLLASGLTRRAIDRAAGMPLGSTSRIVTRKAGVLASTAEAIRGVATSADDPGSYIPVERAREIVEEMRGIGMLWRDIDRLAGKHEGWTQHLLRHRWVRAETMKRLRLMKLVLAAQGLVEAAA